MHAPLASLSRSSSALALACGMAACIGGSTPQPVYYALEGAAERDTAARTPSEGRRFVDTRDERGPTLAVTRFDARAPYDRTELVYRTRERELRTYEYDLWASKPGRMLAEAVTQRLSATRRFADVRYGPVVGDADFELRGEVVAIEEHDVDARTWHARLAMRLELVACDGGQVVLRHAFDTERPVPAREVREVARVLDEILADELGLFAARLGEALPPAAQ